ncbi:MAG: SagB/ThcOx family dehydrogenase [Desulfuromonas sp.]|nr:SagB/ThcOx family dehydrogenase [Desulfuromonas sp.]
MALPSMEQQRDFLKDHLRQQINFYLTDQNAGIAAPPVQRPPRPEQALIELPDAASRAAFAGTDLLAAIAQRQSQRNYTAQPLSLAEVGLLLWATQGIRQTINAGCALRTVPSAGCRHAFESYLIVANVTGLAAGIYRYLPVQHALVCEQLGADFPSQLSAATLNQHFTSQAPLTIVWSVIPYRMEWRYAQAAHRVIAMDVGHVCQNLYLACAAIGAGTCAIAAYDQDKMDALVGVDGEEEFVIYLAPVGKLA